MNHSEIQEIKWLESVFDIEDMDKSDILIFEENDGKLRGEGQNLIFLENGTYQIYIDERNEKSEFCYFEELTDAMNYYFWWIYFFENKLKSYTITYLNKNKDIHIPRPISVKMKLEIFVSELERRHVPASSYQIVTDEVTPTITDGWVLQPLDDKVRVYFSDHGHSSRMCIFNKDRVSDASNFLFWTLTGAETHRDIYARHHPDEHRASDVT